MADEEREPQVITSPLSAWPGSITLPHPDDFSRLHWQTWRESVEMPLRSSYSMMHLNAYAGCELIEAHGEWDMSVPLAEVQAWERDPAAEHVKLIAWLGRTMLVYMREIIDPKD